MDQHPHPYYHCEHIHFRGANISQPNVYTVVTVLGNTPNLNNHLILDNHLIIDATGRRSGLGFAHHRPVNSHYRNFHTSVTSTSHGVSTNLSHSAAIPIQNGFEMDVRHFNFAASTSRLRVDQRHRGETTFELQNLPPMGVIQVDDTALLVDHGRDIHMDIEDVSYEGLLALGEQIGNVKRGLSEEMIASQMMTKTAVEQETDSCVICQEEYKKGEMIGILPCGHKYHADCLRKWLLEKNVCPMCKSKALTPRGMGV